MSIHTRKLKDVMPRQAMVEKMLGKALKYLGDDKDKNAGTELVSPVDA